MGKSSTDRREHDRLPVSIELEGSHPEHGVKARMTASNLSLGGMYCVSNHDFPEMTRLAVRMMLPTDGRSAPRDPVDLEAVVVRREASPSPTGGNHHYHLALFFTRIEDDDRVAIADYLQGNA